MADRRVLIDSGPMIAIFSSRDARHSECLGLLDQLAPPLSTCWPVVTEVTWMLRRYPRSIDRMFESIAGGVFEVLDLDSGSIMPLKDFLRRYESIGAQLADAALVYLAEREDIGTVFTLDLKDFSVYRYGRNRALRLIPGPP